MAVYRVADLPPDALAAAARFHAEDLPRILAVLAGQPAHVVLVFPVADHAHAAWRLAAVQGLARDHAPVRVNAASGADEVAIAAAVSYLAKAEGVTGQVLVLDSAGAREVLSPAG